MTGFKQQTSTIGSNRSADWATNFENHGECHFAQENFSVSKKSSQILIMGRTLLRDYVWAFHPAALGSNPEHTM